MNVFKHQGLSQKVSCQHQAVLAREVVHTNVERFHQGERCSWLRASPLLPRIVAPYPCCCGGRETSGSSRSKPHFGTLIESMFGGYASQQVKKPFSSQRPRIACSLHVRTPGSDRPEVEGRCGEYNRHQVHRLLHVEGRKLTDAGSGWGRASNHLIKIIQTRAGTSYCKGRKKRCISLNRAESGECIQKSKRTVKQERLGDYMRQVNIYHL